MHAVAQPVRFETTIRIDERGIPTIDILEQKQDEDGEVFSYIATRAPDGLDAWALTLERTDGESETYRVALDLRGRWWCDCPDAKYRGRQRACKHTKACAGLQRLIEALR